MKKCLVIGGGFAGLSSAVYLSDKNHKVTLLEASPKLGGRAYSIYDSKLNRSYDNGQHIIMGCYNETLRFISTINSSHLLEIPDSLSINFIKKGGDIFQLRSPKKKYPFNLLTALLNYKAISLKSRLKIIDFFLDLLCCYSCDLKDKTVIEWMKDQKQTEEAIDFFWSILVVGALNTTIEKASAAVFAEILKRIFFDGTNSSAIILSKVGLSELYVKPSVDFILSHGSEIKLSERIIKIEFEGNRVLKVISEKSSYDDFDYVISAIPSYAISKIFQSSGINYYNLPSLSYGTIINIHLWLNQNPFTERFYGFLDGKIHWVFNHGDHISITISAADQYNDKSEEEILNIIYSDLEIFFPIFISNLVKDFRVIKEKRATFIPDISSLELRKEISTQFENLILAGDWINTKLPSTIESAVMSGRLAAESID
ncbi:MAG: hydroxysqualene dehydroxylase HpnE [Melioribacteraceae bacterium]|nr:hydroxysqualene dehydroxylase HpnE [Melioribacteraceae bacterium]